MADRTMIMADRTMIMVDRTMIMAVIDKEPWYKYVRGSCFNTHCVSRRKT